MITKTRAFTLIDLLMLVAVLAIAAAILLPVIARPNHRNHAPRLNCVNNLKQTGLSFLVFAIDNNDLFPMQLSQTNGNTMESASSDSPWRHFQVISNELSTPKILVCPADSSRSFATNFTSDFNNSRLSYFVNLDAQKGGTNVQMVLSGDRNLSVSGKPAEAIITIRSNSLVSWTAEIHKNNGNILLIDGSVHQVSSGGLRSFLNELPEGGVRLAMP